MLIFSLVQLGICISSYYFGQAREMPGFSCFFTTNCCCLLNYFIWSEAHTPVIPALGRQKQDNHEFEASLDYISLSTAKGGASLPTCPHPVSWWEDLGAEHCLCQVGWFPTLLVVYSLALWRRGSVRCLIVLDSNEIWLQDSRGRIQVLSWSSVCAHWRAGIHYMFTCRGGAAILVRTQSTCTRSFFWRLEVTLN
jgi:hypothetical protein